MRKVIEIVIVTSLVLITSCYRNEQVDQTELISVKLVPSHINTIPLDSLVRNVKYVALETGPNCLIEKYDDIQIVADKIFISSNSGMQQAIFVFDMQGSFLFKIDAHGRGPGEYLHVSSFIVDGLEEQIIVFDQIRASVYDFNGDFVKSHLFTNIHPGSNTVLFSGKYYTYALNFDAQARTYSDPDMKFNTIAIFDSAWSLISHSFPRSNQLIQSMYLHDDKNTLIKGRESLYLFDHYSGVLNEVKDLDFIPRYQLDYGEHAISEMELVQILNSGGDYYSHLITNNLSFPSSTKVLVTDDYFIITSTIGSRVYSFIGERVAGGSFLMGEYGSFCRLAPSLHLISSDGNTLFGAITASEIVNKRRMCDGRPVEETGPFGMSGLKTIDSIEPEDNAVIVLFDLRNDLIDIIKPEIEWIDISGGTYKMGSDERFVSTNNEKPIREVTLSPFRMSKYEITFAQYDLFCEATGREKPDDEGWGRENRPVINVTWHDAVAFAKWMGCRLPTEAEWEYAARAGTTTQFYTGDCITTDQANFDGTSPFNSPRVDCPIGIMKDMTLDVGSYLPNPWGLFDMAGNVGEWVSDWYDDYPNRSETNPIGPADDSPRSVNRVFRGGSWDIPARFLRSSSRMGTSPEAKGKSLGFRLVKDIN